MSSKVTSKQKAQRAYIARKKQLGLIRKEAWLLEEDVKKLKTLENDSLEKAKSRK